MLADAGLLCFTFRRYFSVSYERFRTPPLLAFLQRCCDGGYDLESLSFGLEEPRSFCASLLAKEDAEFSAVGGGSKDSRSGFSSWYWDGSCRDDAIAAGL